ncbi:MAG: hypothetical protein K6E33_06325 [Lachnospiraceae bacterium]|nr:hypothetical protein [Lachnospiraceae bacterium]
MLEEALNTVKDAEKKAAERIRAAEDEGNKLIEDARKKATDMKENTANEIRQSGMDQVRKAESDLSQSREQAREDVSGEIRDMKAAALTRESKAVDAVIDKLVG